MQKIKDFMNSISKTGWIIVSVIVVVLILLVVGILLVKKEGVSKFFNNKPITTEESVSDSEKKLLTDLGRETESSNDSVLSSEDVLNDKYDNSVKAANLFVKNTKEVQVAVVIDDAEYAVANSKNLSCGKLAFVSVRVLGKPGIINETLKAIFADKIITDFLPGNVIPKYHPNLAFDNVILENGVVQIYLKGDFSSNKNSKCEMSLAISQITETVKQFEGVKSVEIYQNLNKIN